MKDNKSKNNREQLFKLLAGTVAAIFVLGCTGCEMPKSNSYSSEENEDEIFYEVKGCSVPGCGGCFTDGEGCGSCLWAQSVKCITASGKVQDEKIGTINSCDTVYYSESCMGCGNKEQHVYTACFTLEDEGFAFAYGDDKEAHYWSKNTCNATGSSLTGELKAADEYLGIH